MQNSTYLTAQLRESAPYLGDAGFRETASLLLAAANEIESLNARLAGAADAKPDRPDTATPKRPHYKIIPFLQSSPT